MLGVQAQSLRAWSESKWKVCGPPAPPTQYVPPSGCKRRWLRGSGSEKRVGGGRVALPGSQPVCSGEPGLERTRGEKLRSWTSEGARIRWLSEEQVDAVGVVIRSGGSTSGGFVGCHSVFLDHIDIETLVQWCRRRRSWHACPWPSSWSILTCCSPSCWWPKVPGLSSSPRDLDKCWGPEPPRTRPLAPWPLRSRAGQSGAPWQLLAQDRAAWRAREPDLIARLMWCSIRSVARLPSGRHMHVADEEWT